ncbi:MAG: response regulator [Planctomycetaceae bacterium]
MNDALRVLFVDDDSAWLNALRRRLKKSDPGWDVQFASSPVLALELMQEQPFDVVVSDLNMPGFRGDSFLGQVAELWPETLRFMLSGSSSSECQSGSRMLAMEFISKDSEADDLLFAIARGVALKRFMRSRVIDRLADAVSRLGGLPNLNMRLINPGTNDQAGHACMEITCPDLGLDFRIPLKSNHGTGSGPTL